MSFVLDNSVALAWCFVDEQTPSVMNLLDRVVATGAVAPLLWPLEALNGLLVAERRNRLGRDKRARLIGFLRDLPIMLDAHTAEQAWETTRRLAEQHRLSVYDAAYLEVAQRRRLPLASLDQDLRHAAHDVGVEVLG
ncbi:MAG: type II toxin-antitoxin system VapC family toxin [Geminicoccaceae bacterium]